MSFLVLGHGKEETIKHFLVKCDEAEINYNFLDFDIIRRSNRLRIEVDSDSLEVIINENQIINFSNYSAFYSRLYFDQTDDPKDASIMHSFLMATTAYLESCGQLVVNKPSAGISNSNKFRHLHDLERSGFHVPETHIIGCQDLFRSLIIDPSEWVNKSISSIKTQAILASEVEADTMLLDKCPSLFQKKIDGFDVRIHTIGDKLVPLKISNSSKTIDYRFDSKNNRYGAIKVPNEVKLSCLKYCKAHGLEFCGFDFKVHDGHWTVLEANPMPGFDFFDKNLDGAISRCLIDLLAAAKVSHPAETEVEGGFVAVSRRPVPLKML